MDMISTALVVGIVIVGIILVALTTALIISKRREKNKTGMEDTSKDDYANAGEEHSSKPGKIRNIAGEEVDIDITGIALADPALDPLLEHVDFSSDETEGLKFEQFNTVAASVVAKDIVDTHGATGFRIMYKGCFTADVLMYKFYYIEVKDKEAVNGSVYYIIYESGVQAYGLYIGEDEELINETYLVNRQTTM